MGDDASSVKTLKKSYKTEIKASDWKGFYQECKNANDRSLVVMMAAMLDKSLESEIAYRKRRLKADKDREHMFGANGPLFSFSAKIEIAYYFSIIDERTRDRLDIVREMRNACAHSHRAISFKDPELRNVALRLLPPAGPTGSQFNANDPEVVRQLFILETFHLSFAMGLYPVRRGELLQHLEGKKVIATKLRRRRRT